jgi:hypothetical protein
MAGEQERYNEEGWHRVNDSARHLMRIGFMVLQSKG